MNKCSTVIGFLLSFITLAIAQQPLALEVAFTGQSAGDQSKPNIEVTLSNISGRAFKVLNPNTAKNLPSF